VLDTVLQVAGAVALGLVALLGLTILAAIAIVFVSGTESVADDLDYDFED
jgi:hypothetical protein